MNKPTRTLNTKPYLCSAYLAKAGRLLLGEKSLADAATSSVELAPSRRFMHPAPVFAPADLDRITGVGAGTSVAFERSQTLASWRTHRATTAHQMNDLLLIDGSLYKGRFKHGISLDKGPLLAAGMAPRTAHGVLAQSWLGTKYFGHWLMEDVLLGLLASRRGDAIGIARPSTAQQNDYANFFHCHHYVLPRIASFESIEILSDQGLNEFHIDRLKKLRATFADASLHPRHSGVFLMRGSTGESRQLVNEFAVADFLVKRGFKVINPGTENMQAVRSAVANANVVVGVEGSQLSHGVLGLANGGAMVVLQPPSRFNNAFKERCDLLGITYAFMVCDLAGQGFAANTLALGRLLDRVQTATQGSAYAGH